MTPTSDPQWEKMDCGFCGCDQADPVLQGPDRLLDLPGVFNVVRCTRCGLLRQNPRLTIEAMQQYYPPDYEPFVTAIEDEPSRIARWDRRYGMQKRVRLIERLRPEGRLLDVGCATGLFLAELKRTGRWSVMGLEPNPVAASYARERFNLEIVEATLDGMPGKQSPFHVITLWNVLEHLHDPFEALHRVAALLADGGWAVVTIPNLESFEARVFGPAWLGWELPRHIYWFPQASLPAVFEAAGLKIHSMHCLMSGHNTFGLSLRFWLKERLSGSRIAHALLRLYFSFPVRGVLMPCWWALGHMRKLTLLTVVARKAPEEMPVEP